MKIIAKDTEYLGQWNQPLIAQSLKKKQVNLERRQIGMSRHINVTDF